MGNIKTIENLIITSIKEINEQLPQEQQLGQSTKTVLFGKDGKLDSLDLVTLLVIILIGLLKDDYLKINKN